MPGPSAIEERIVFHTNQLLRDLAEGRADEQGRHGAPWRLESERKVVGIGECKESEGEELGPRMDDEMEKRMGWILGDSHLRAEEQKG